LSLNTALVRLVNSADIYWVRDIEPHRLAFGPRPRAGDWLADEISSWFESGIRHVVSLLEDHETRELGIAEEAELCSKNGITYHAFPIVDRGVPATIVEAKELFQKIALLVALGEPVYVHCRAGIGRSGLVTAGVLVHLGVPFESAFAMLSAARRLQVPDTQSQIEWTCSYAKRLGVDHYEASTRAGTER
jgi:protein-tyrosine phosphatase